MLYKNLFIFLFLMFTTNQAVSDHSQRHQKVDDMSIYLGVVPAQLTQHHSTMHSGITNEEHSYHIVIALFNSKSGKRITDARVKASVASLGMKGETKDLEPMHGDLLSYGNYFTMYKATNYTIKVEIQRADEKVKSIAMFILKPPRY